MDPLSYLDQHVNFTGVGEHTINDIPIARFCAVSQSHYGNVLCVYHEYAGGNIQERTIHSKIQLMDYGNKVNDTARSLRGQQTIIAHGGHIFPLSMQNGLCHLVQRILTDEEMRVLPQVIMTSDCVWDPSIYDDKVTMSEHFKHRPHIPAGENEEMYDIEDNLDIGASLSKSNSASFPAPIVVETVEVDEFEEQDTGSVSVVFADDETTMPPPNIDISPNERFIFIPFKPTIDNDDDIPINPIPPKKVSFVPTCDEFVPCKDPVPIAESQRHKQTNKHYSSRMPRPVNIIPPQLSAP